MRFLARRSASSNRRTLRSKPRQRAARCDQRLATCVAREEAPLCARNAVAHGVLYIITQQEQIARDLSNPDSITNEIAVKEIEKPAQPMVNNMDSALDTTTRYFLLQLDRCGPSETALSECNARR